MLLLLTGAIGVGKTTVCCKVVGLARAGGRQPRGILTPPLYDADGAKAGFEALDVASGRRWPLAHKTEPLGGPRVGPYAFDRSGLERALRALRKAMAPGTDLLVVDEIGPLELEQGDGFAPLLEALPRGGPDHVLLVVRSGLVEAACRRLRAMGAGPSIGGLGVYTVTLGNREGMARSIVEALWPDDVSPEVSPVRVRDLSRCTGVGLHGQRFGPKGR